MRRHNRSVVWLMAALLATAATDPAATQQQKEKLNATLASLAKTKEEQAKLDKKYAEARRELEKLQSRAAELARSLQNSERRVSGEEDALHTVSGKLTQRQQQFEARKADYIATVLTLLRVRRLPVTSLYSASPEELHKLMLTASLLEKTNSELAKKAKILRGDMDALKTLRGETATRRERTNTETAVLQREQAALEKTLRERQKIYDRIESDRAQTKTRIEKLSRESQSLQDLIARIETQRAESKTKTPPPPKSGSGKGNYTLPVAGQTIHRFGESKSAAENYRGMVVKARSGATVVAPNDGQVVFTGPFRDYGNIVLIKHPGGYISLLAGVGKISSATGQNVKKGEPVAVMGSGSPEAYIELRDSSSKPIDPAAWFANVNAAAGSR